MSAFKLIFIGSKEATHELPDPIDPRKLDLVMRDHDHAFFYADKGTVCHVRCLRSPAPVFLRQKGFGEEFYIRTGPSSASLEIREALQYISERFPTK